MLVCLFNCNTVIFFHYVFLPLSLSDLQHLVKKDQTTNTTKQKLLATKETVTNMWRNALRAFSTISRVQSNSHTSHKLCNKRLIRQHFVFLRVNFNDQFISKCADLMHVSVLNLCFCLSEYHCKRSHCTFFTLFLIRFPYFPSHIRLSNSYMCTKISTKIIEQINHGN